MTQLLTRERSASGRQPQRPYEPGDAPPRWEHVPEAATSAAVEAIELAASAGLELDPWQERVLVGSLGERLLADGSFKWAATRVGLVVPRQNGKGSILEARELAGLFTFREKVMVHTAHRVDTAELHYKRMRELIESNPDLEQQVRRMPEGNGQQLIELKKHYGGGTLYFKSRAKEGSRGWSGDLLVFDEALWLASVASSVSSLSARPNPQIWITSSAPTEREESELLRKMMREGRALAVEHGLAPAA